MVSPSIYLVCKSTPNMLESIDLLLDPSLPSKGLKKNFISQIYQMNSKSHGVTIISKTRNKENNR